MRRWLVRLVLVSPWVAIIPLAVADREATTVHVLRSVESVSEAPLAEGFDFPVGPPDAQGYYNAQGFGQDRHLGEDWNGLGGGDSDYGDPVHAIGDGVVSFAAHLPGNWGNVVRIVHRYQEGEAVHEVESLYAHLSGYTVGVGDVVTRGEQIGRIGDADGAYIAHLHLELRMETGMSIGPGYSESTRGYLSPTAFISARR